MLSYRRVHDLEDWSQHWNGRGLICTPSSLHLGIFIQLIFFLHNSSKINGTYNMILSICLVKIQYSLVLGCQFSVSPSLDTIPMDRISLTSDSCAPQLWTQQSCSSFTLPDILGHRLLVTFLFSLWWYPVYSQGCRHVLLDSSIVPSNVYFLFFCLLIKSVFVSMSVLLLSFLFLHILCAWLALGDGSFHRYLCSCPLQLVTGHLIASLKV